MAQESPSSTLEPSRYDERLNTIFSVLRHPTRRHILATIRDSQSHPSGGFALDDFLEDDGTSEDSPAGLHHSHLPKLDNAGFIDWDRQTNTVMRGPRFDEIESVLEILQTRQDAFPGDGQ